jgi:radical SAM superfamily enzyme YgiQ (UPF0313 family)
MRVLILNTYDLGRQPFGVASAAAWLRRDGFAVDVQDLAIERLDDAMVRGATVVALHVPMHTATRLALAAVARVRAAHPSARLACFGLYAAMNEPLLRSIGVEAVLSGECEPGLVAFARHVRDGAGPFTAATVSLDRIDFAVPDRAGLPPLERYAALDDGDGHRRRVASVEASRGCRHRCRHCPVVPVYGGRFRIVPREVVLADIRAQVAAGATHVTFGDPDFLNGPGHALPIVEALHAEFPHVSYDVTIKVEHLIAHDRHLERLRDTGCAFVTTAVESLDDAVLAKLDKGHTRADFERVVRRFAEIGLGLQPTFLAFTPWTTAASHLELLETLETFDLVERVAPVQLALRLLIPAGSRLLELDELAPRLGAFDAERLVWPWTHADPAMDALQRRLDAVVREGLAAGGGRRPIFERVHAETAAAAGRARRMRAAAVRPKRPPIPFLTEPWYC